MAKDIVKDGKLKATMPELKQNFSYSSAPDALAAMLPGNGSWQPPKPGDKPELASRFEQNTIVEAMMQAFPPGGDGLGEKPPAKPSTAPKL